MNLKGISSAHLKMNTRYIVPEGRSHGGGGSDPPPPGQGSWDHAGPDLRGGGANGTRAPAASFKKRHNLGSWNFFFLYLCVDFSPTTCTDFDDFFIGKGVFSDWSHIDLVKS